MKIESIIKRVNGTTVDFGNGAVYVFNAANKHTCTVTDEDHIDRFLSIREGYRAVDEDVAVAVPVEPVGATPGTVPEAAVVQTAETSVPVAATKKTAGAPRGQRAKGGAKGNSQPK